MTNSDRLQEIRERADKATPGPWEKTGPWHPIEPKTRQLPDVYSNVQTPQGSIADCWPWTDHEANAAFIAEARSDIPYLLQLVTEQQREIDRCRKALEAVNEFAKEDDICTHKTIGEQHGWGACFVCLIQATAQGALRGENGPFESDDEPEAKGYRKQERPI